MTACSSCRRGGSIPAPRPCALAATSAWPDRRGMLDARLRKLIDPPLDALGRRLAHLGVTANSVTWTGFLVGCGPWALLVLPSSPAPLALLLLNDWKSAVEGKEVADRV